MLFCVKERLKKKNDNWKKKKLRVRFQLCIGFPNSNRVGGMKLRATLKKGQEDLMIAGYTGFRGCPNQYKCSTRRKRADEDHLKKSTESCVNKQ